MGFGEQTLQRGDSGPDVVELQLRLAGFRGSVWDGNYGPGTELQVAAFQRDYMGMAAPNGVADIETLAAIQGFAAEFPVDFAALLCPCGQCGGLGRGLYKGEYRGPRAEAYHKYEYPGIHKAILHTFRAAAFYAKSAFGLTLTLSSGYRCWLDNRMRGRTSTNHMGKAVDCDFPLEAWKDKAQDMQRCNLMRGLLVEKGAFQIGWSASNQKALEPSNIAPTWIHMDVRCYAPEFLREEFFVKSAAELDGLPETPPAAADGPPPEADGGASREVTDIPRGLDSL